VCVETLKRDWKSELRLRDVLVTISCLLIQPNPASALNEAAGKLASEDWAGFERRARLMTGIHAAVPRELVDDVSGAQRRGDDVPDKAKGKSAVKEDSKEKVKKVSATPTLRKSLDEEDEENRRKRSVTVEMTSSNSDDDWIPGPVKSPKAFPAARDNNIFGIRGLDDAMQLDSPQKPRPSSSKAPNHEIIHDHDISDPFITVSPKRPAPTSTSFNLRIPPPAEPTSNSRTFSHPNPFSAIQTAPSTTRPHPLLTEFSWSWQDSEILHGTGTIKDGPSKADVLKRMAGADFEQQRKWEMKRFKKTGYDLAKYNRGDFGPRTGIARL
jgi:ubiquitin-conjugating enzyme E2 S